MVSVSVPHACSVRRNCPHGFVHNLWLLVELLGGAKGHCTACSRFQAAQRELAGSASRQAARSARQHAPASEQLPESRQAESIVGPRPSGRPTRSEHTSGRSLAFLSCGVRGRKANIRISIESSSFQSVSHFTVPPSSSFRDQCRGDVTAVGKVKWV